MAKRTKYCGRRAQAILDERDEMVSEIVLGASLAAMRVIIEQEQSSRLERFEAIRDAIWTSVGNIFAEYEHLLAPL